IFATSRIKLAPLTAISLSSSVTTTSNSSSPSSSTYFYGLCYVVRDDVETNQIIPTQYYSSLDHYPLRFVEDDGIKSKYSIIIAGNNFGCGREHAAVDALSDAGTRAVVAESYDGVFLKNSNSSGLIFALESEVRICDEFKTGDVATVDVEERVLVNQTTGIVYQLKAVAADAVS
ncbi:3-isopropylmalate dehydratase small subunit 3-like, partial [Chenopodium quinoa]|uniref:3-isopropylmalate dehydratase small subunit 3-like n=1 Tax=Chenopodium quinoa TaxID=63459 RepID=UPI000B7999F1